MAGGDPQVKRLLTLILMVAVASSAHATQVIRRADIDAAGITRLAEILTLADGWAVNTTDGYTFRASPNGTAPFQQQRWIVMVDDQVFDVGLFDTIDLNLLPISIDQVESVTVRADPVFVQGVYHGDGTIHFRTTGIRPGWSTQLHALGGNETGDPGPYRYTELRSDNIDAIGPDLGLTLGYRRGDLQVKINSSVLVHYFTDPAMRRSNGDILGLNDPDYVTPDTDFGDIFFDPSSPAVRRASTSMQVTHTSRSQYQRGFLSYSSARKYMHYSETFGRHLPTDHTMIHAGVNGSIIVQRQTLDYSTSYSRSQLSRHPGARFDYDWELHRSRTRVELHSVLDEGVKTVTATTGIGLDHAWAETSFTLDDNTTLTVPVYGEVRFDAGGGMHRVGAEVTFVDESQAERFYTRSEWRVNNTHRLAYSVSFAERLFDEEQSIWFWQQRGYALFDSNDVDFEINGAFGTSRTTTADATWDAEWRDTWFVSKLKTSLNANYRRFEDLYLERHDFSFNETTCSFTGPTEVVTGQDGHVAGGRIRVSADVLPRLSATLRYHYQRAFDSDAAFDDAWAAVPNHRASLRLSATPRRGINSWLSVAYQSATDWADYAGADGAVCHSGLSRVTYHSRVDEFVTVDAGIRKYLWRRKASFDILARNIFNERIQYHPAGATFDLSFFAQLRVSLR